ncbi:DUF4340 domain-containing protein [Gracilibacillus dipsosauri]|uniref:DUF4340 domain-containing protein n=1 Tax=Gracilibacillus dipsosauri TaxID=178340 RepID=UPI002409C513
MKKHKFIIWLVLGIIAIVALLFIISNQTDSEKNDNKNVAIVKDFKEITSIKVLADKKVELKKESDQWRLQGVGREQNNEKVSHFVETMQGLQGVEANVKPNEVSLQFPEVTVVFADEDGDKQRVSVGQTNVNGDKYYIEHHETETIYLVDRTDIETIPLNVNSLLDNQIISINAKELEKIDIENGTETIQLRNDSPFTERESLAHISGWYMYQPYKSVYSVAFSKMEAILGGLEGLTKTQVVEDATKLGKTDFKITFQAKDQSETLLIGEPAANQQYYAKLEGEDEVFTVTTEALEPYSHPSFDLIDHFVHILPLNAVKELKIQSNEYHWTVLGEHKRSEDEEETESSFIINDKPIRLIDWREAYQTLAGLTFDEVVEDLPQEMERELMIQYTADTDQEQDPTYSLEFLSMDDKYFALNKNNEGIDFIIEKDKVYQALEALANVLP